MMTFTSDQWAILALVFVLGLLIGAFLFTGGGRKWKQRYRAEVDRREALERDLRDREAHWATREKEWRTAAPIHDRDRDGIDDRREVGYRGRDRDGDGIPDSRDPIDDRDRRPL